MGLIIRLWNWFKRQRLDLLDVGLIIVLVVGAYYGYNNLYKYDLSLDKTLTLSSPWLAKTDNLGNTYVVDAGRTRIVVIDKNHQISRTINTDPNGSDTFWYPDNICLSDKGGVYVQDTWWSASGFSLDGECIMYYGPDGKFQRYVYEVGYEDVYADKHRIFGLTEYNNMVYFVAADEKGFVLNSIAPSGGKVKQIASYSFDNAITLIQDFALDPGSQVIYGVDKRGRLLMADKGTVTQVQDVYQNAGANEKIALYRATVDNKGNVYVTDIASNCMYYFDKTKGYAYSKLPGEPGIWNVDANRQNGNISLVMNDQIFVRDSSGNIILEGSEFQKSQDSMKKELIFDLAVLLAAISALYVFLRIFSLVVSFKYSTNQLTGVLVASAVLIVTSIIVSQLMGEFKTIYRNEIINKLEMSAQIVSNTTDTGALKSIKNSKDYMNNDYKKLLTSVNNTLDKSADYSQDIYCNILRCEGDEVYAIAYIDNSIGAYFPLFGAEAQEAQKVYKTGKTLRSDTAGQTGSYIYVKSPIYDGSHKVVAVVEVGTDANVLNASVNSMLRKIAIPLIMAILVILFLFQELFSFFDLRSRYRDEVLENKRAVPLHLVRFSVFATFMAFNMATSFLPVYILKFVGADFGITRELAASIPMSVNLAFVAIVSLVCAPLLNALGFRKVAAVSACLAFAGDLILAFAQNYSMVMAGLALNGLGVGLIINSILMFMASSKLGADKNGGYGFSIFNASSLAGINCGMMLGAAIAEGLNQGNVFLVSAAAWFVLVLIFLVIGKSINIVEKREEAEFGSMSLKQFVFNKHILTFMALIQVPYIAMSSFTYYYVPIFAAGQGLGENESCMLIMISSLCSVYLSVALTEYLGNKIKSNTIYLSSLLTFAALILFAVHMTIPMLIISLVLIGVANSFGTSSRVNYFTNSKEAMAFGQHRSMGIYNFVDNLGESLGPMIMAGIISTGFLAGMLKIVALFTSMNGLFAISRREDKQKDMTAGM